MIVTPEMESIVADQAFRDAYRAWLDNPVTKRMLAFAKQAARPLFLQETRAEPALYYSGQVDAVAAYETAITEFVPRVMEFTALKSKTLEPRYGAKKPEGAK